VVCAKCHFVGLASGIDWTCMSSEESGAHTASTCARTARKRASSDCGVSLTAGGVLIIVLTNTLTPLRSPVELSSAFSVPSAGYPRQSYRSISAAVPRGIAHYPPATHPAFQGQTRSAMCEDSSGRVNYDYPAPTRPVRLQAERGAVSPGRPPAALPCRLLVIL